MKGYLTLIAIFRTLIGPLTSLICSRESPNKIWPIPQIDGSIRWMTRGQAMAEALFTEHLAVASPRKLDKVRFFLYTQSNPTVPYEIIMTDPSSLSNSPFNANNPTRFYTHGWNGGYIGEKSSILRESLLLNGDNGQFNFFVVDWSVYAETLNYISAVIGCSKAGKAVAVFIDWLNITGNLSFDTLIFAGHSLGAHVAGFERKNVKRGRINTIIGLDTAMLLFDYCNPDTRLANTDAEYLESIHTNGGILGFYLPIGGIAFYPNGGQYQPGCGIDLFRICSHDRAVHYLAEAWGLGANNGFNTVRCSQFNDVTYRSCDLYSDGVRLGDPSNANKASGVYFLNTNSDPLFGLGN